MMNKERLTIEEQLEEIKECGRRFNDVQYYCLYKYDIERIIPYIEDLQQKIDKAIECIKDFEIQANHINDDIYLDETLSNKLLKILGGKE